MSKIYLACSFAYEDSKVTQSRKDNINIVASILRGLGHTVFVPHEHKIPNAWEFTNEQWGTLVFGNDINALQDSDYVIGITYGKKDNNDGFAWECGYSFGIHKKVILIKATSNIESIMLLNSCYSIFRGYVSNGKLSKYKLIIGLRDLDKFKKDLTDCEQS